MWKRKKTPQFLPTEEAREWSEADHEFLARLQGAEGKLHRLPERESS